MKKKNGDKWREHGSWLGDDATSYALESWYENFVKETDKNKEILEDIRLGGDDETKKYFHALPPADRKKVEALRTMLLDFVEYKIFAFLDEAKEYGWLQSQLSRKKLPPSIEKLSDALDPLVVKIIETLERDLKNLPIE